MNNLFFRYAFLFTLLCLLAADARAIPAFARRYALSCNACHDAIPKLKPFGEEFAANGYQLADREAADFTTGTGDDLLLLMRELPLAIRFEGFLRWQPQSAHRSDIQVPYLMKIISGGSIASNLSYYFYFFFGEEGRVTGLEDAYLIFHNLFNSTLSVTVGQFQVSDPMFKRELRFESEDYRIYDAKIGKSSAKLTYDRGVMVNYALPSHTQFAAAVVNGSGIGETDAVGGFDNDRYKNLFLRASQQIGGILRVGGMGYYGREEQGNIRNTLRMGGVDVSLTLAPLEFNLQYLERADDNPDFLADPAQIHTRGGFAELIYTPGGGESRWRIAALYNRLACDLDNRREQTVTGHLSWLLARNFRIAGEYTYDLEEKANSLSLGFVTAF